jgi:hypothetical protein
VTHENRAVRKGRAHLVIAALVAALLVLTAVPAFAAADPIEINSLGDSAQANPGPTCDTGAPSFENCTLRAAIEAADYESDPNVIEFPNPPFEGGQQIVLGSTLPPIIHPVTITAQSHAFSEYNGPSVGVTIPSGAVGLRVQSNGVTVENMAFGGGKVGIEVQAGAKGFTAKGDWFGLDVTATTATIQGPGIVLGPGADEANIGGTAELSRNVFTHATYGIYVEGASQAEILGNYIGVGPAGGSGFGPGAGAAGISNAVRIVDTSTSTAKDNVVGGTRTSASGATDCGGACNVIVASGLGIDLHGEAGKGSPSGPTTISGNYIGLAADGSELSSPGAFCQIYAERPTGAPADHGPGDVTVGGSTPAEGNVIDHGAFGMIAEGAEGLLVEGNLFGWLPASVGEGSAPDVGGLVVLGEGVANRAEVVGNAMYLGPNAVGIESYGPGADIVNNAIFGSKTGVLTAEADGGSGNRIAGNFIEGANLYGVLLENNDNTLTGNSIDGSGRSGIITDQEEPSTKPWPTANRIGGDSPDLENRIEDSGESAISVGGEPETTNEVLGNFGLGNGGPFILLRQHHAGHPTNEEITPPTVEVAYESSASGTAKPGAKVRLFGKPSTDPGSLEPMIGSAYADASGHWSATFTTKQPVGRLVAGTQTTAAGSPAGATSEVSTPKAAVADPIPPEEPTGGGGGGGGGGSGGTGAGTSGPPPPPALAKVAPKVSIVSGPKKTTEATTAKFKFKVTNTSGAKFECKLDSAKWAKCSSPKTLKKLKVGKHTFRVRATASGLTGAAVKYQFTVKA